MRELLTFFVEGDPKGQPRARACIRGKHAGVYDPGTSDNWKMCVAEVWRRVSSAEPVPANLLVAVNQEYGSFSQTVRDGDEVAFFPPVTGG